jgi:signal transduction histidine kinase
VREVSCRALEPFFKAVDRRGIPRSALVLGTGFGLNHLQNVHERVEWDAFRAFMSNVRTHFDEAALREIGAVGLHTAGFRSFALIGRTLFSPSGFYRWMLTSGGMGNQLFSNMVPRYRELAPGHFMLSLEVAPGYEPCPDFFHFAAGGFQEIPKLVGLERAEVRMTPIERGASFDIKFKDTNARRAKLLNLLTRPFDARATANELDDAIKTLEARYADLESARNTLERQRALLDTAYRLGHRMWGELDALAIASVVVGGLVEVPDIAGARLRAAHHGVADIDAEDGAIGSPEEAIGIELAARRAGGRLEIWVAPGGRRAEASTLLELLAPTAALAIDNAYAVRELAVYQKDLERLVEERTRELRGARDDLAGTVVQLRDAQEARERIFTNISHEIRTPLAVILLAVGDVESRAALDPRSRDDLASVVESARRLLRLVDELLLLAAGQETTFRVAPIATDLARLVGAVAVTWRPAAEAAGLTMTYHGLERCVVMADPIAIERVVTNLLSNAVKYTPSGGRVDLSLEADETTLTIAVRDTGIGIDDDLRQRLFGRFERGSGAGRRGGSGIGLSLVKELAEAHGGSVIVERARGGGSEFVVTLPRLDPVEAPHDDTALQLRPGDFGLTAPPLATGAVLTPPGRSTATILVAEDDPQLAARISRLLSQEYTVIVALDGLAALELARQHQPHLLVTDVDMPGMDGIELTRRFREATGEKLAPVMILSALADLGDRISGLEAGATDYITKPFDPRELRARVRSQLAMRELALRLHRAEQLSALGALSSGLAHELRNPANAIVNAVGPLKRLLPPELADPESPVGQLVDVLKSCAEQVAFLSRQLLSFRRGGDLDLRVVPLMEVVNRAITLAQPALRDVTLRHQVVVQDAIRCAPPLLVQVLTNLFENASHAAGPGGWIELSGSQQNGRITLEVADSGPGVPVEIRERVFEPFFTTKPPGQGTGLGLPLARDIMHRHGGILEIRERDQRAVFVIEIPVAPR